MLKTAPDPKEICPGCHRRVNEPDPSGTVGELVAEEHGQWWHKLCHDKTAYDAGIIE
jgi:hypothetical protein